MGLEGVVTTNPNTPSLFNEEAFLSASGLTPREILVLAYAPSFTLDQTEFQAFWHWEYEISEPMDVVRRLMDKGYLVVGNAFDTLENQKATDIKELLRAHSLKLSGKKADLLQRIKENLSEEQISAQFPEKYFALTEKGREELDANAHILFSHRHKSIDGLDLWVLNKIVRENPGTGYRDLVWRHMNEKCEEYLRESNSDFYIIMLQHMSTFLHEEDRVDDNITAQIFYYSLQSEYGHYRAGDWGLKDICIPPTVIWELEKMQARLGLDDEHFMEKLIELFRNFPNAPSLLSCEEIARAAIALLRDGDETEIRIIFKETRYHKKGIVGGSKP